MFCNDEDRRNSDYIDLTRKTVSRLEHEVGYGAECLKCKSKCPGFDLHYWNKEDHNIIDDTKYYNLKERIGNVYGFMDEKFPQNSEEHLTLSINPNTLIQTNELIKTNSELDAKYEWHPNGIDTDLFEKYVSLLPKLSRPIKNTPGAIYRKKQIDIQLPLHDFDISACDTMNSDYEKFKFNEFINKFQRNSIGTGIICKNIFLNVNCSKCEKPLSLNEVVVNTPHILPNTLYHPDCVKCSTCNEYLIDLIYFYKDNKLYCGRHYSEQIKPRCAACDEIIFSNEYTKAENQYWHLEHFCCWQCDVSLGGQKYLIIHAKPYCLICYNDKYAKECDTCHEKINAESKHFKHNNLYWHANDTCFSCFTCRSSLKQQPFIFKSGYVFCSMDCKQRIIPKHSDKIGEVVEF